MLCACVCVCVCVFMSVCMYSMCERCMQCDGVSLYICSYKTLHNTHYING